MKPALFLAAAFLLVAQGVGNAPAKVAAPPTTKPIGPRIVVQGEGLKPVTLLDAKVDVVIAGPVARTTMTLSFRNENDRVLEAELQFPLPQGASVTGYGLDVNGEIVDGVPVEKQQARMTFESEVRKGVDPGLAEQVAGNVFRTRIYPVPAKGTRIVKVCYVSDLVAGKDGGLACIIPFDWGQSATALSFHIEALGWDAPPTVEGPDQLSFTFDRRGKNFSAERTFANIKLNGNITLNMAAPKETQSIVDQFPRDGQSAETYFMVSDLMQKPGQDDALKAAQLRQGPARIALLWDASLSRADADKAREIQAVERILKGLAAATPVDVIIFRNIVDSPVTFAAGDIEKVRAFLQGVTYDGGTDLSHLQFPRNIRAFFNPDRAPAAEDYGYLLLVTDGIGNLGAAKLMAPDAPVYCITDALRADYAALEKIARDSGGALLNLRRMDVDAAAARIGAEPFGLCSVEVVKGKADHIRTGDPLPNGRVLICGRLLSDEATLTLNYGFGKRIVTSKTVTLKAQGAAMTGIGGQMWASQEVAALSLDETANHDALLAVGRNFNIVTPNTSLLVLETLQQYQRYHIAPPMTRGQMHADYVAWEKTQAEALAKVEANKLDHVLPMWNARVAWWEKEFKYPADLKYQAPPNQPNGDVRLQAAAGERGGRGGGGGGHATTRADAQAPDAARPVDGLSRQQSPTEPLSITQGSSRFTANGTTTLPGDMRYQHQEASEFYGAGKLDNALMPPSDTPSIAIKAWSPDTPYIKAIRAAGDNDLYAAYLAQRKLYANSPAFYLDCADLFMEKNQRDLAIRILSDVVELQLNDPRVTRIMAHRLEQVGAFDMAIDAFERILVQRPDEPQSHRDLALALADRARFLSATPASAADKRIAADFKRSLELLQKVVMNHWERFDEIETIALMEANAIAQEAQKFGVSNPLDSKLSKNLDCDVRIILTWDTDETDIDLWVTEPSGETCKYDHNRTTIGGAMSKDFTQGYGPEEYIIRNAMKGEYKIQANFYGSHMQQVTGPTTIQATVITHFGRPDEVRKAITLRLTTSKETVDVGAITFTP